MRRIYFAVLFFVICDLKVISQNDNGAIKVLVRDKSTNETIPFAGVVAYKDGVQVAAATTNINGEVVIKPLSPGKYSVKAQCMNYQTAAMTGIEVGEGKTVPIILPLSNNEVTLDDVIIIHYETPLIRSDVSSGLDIGRDEYEKMAVKDIPSALATSAGVYQADNGKGLNVRGTREDQTSYYIDGAKTYGSPNIPQQSIQALSIITGGVPANFGDATAGIISITTRGPQAKYFGGVELISSQLTDAFGYNSLGLSVGGPIYKKRDTAGRERTVLGFFIGAQANYIKEPKPSFIPIWVINDDKLQQIKEQPLTPSPSGTGFIRTSEFVTKNDMHTQKFRPNATQRVLSINGKLDYAPTANMYISVGGFFDYNDASSSGAVTNQIMNSNNNGKLSTRTIRGNVALTQKFGDQNVKKEKTQSRITNAFFKLLVSYEQWNERTQNAKWKDDFFKYGYVGKFERTFLEKDFANNYKYTDQLQINGQTINAYEFQGSQELPVKFTPGTYNPDPALYTSYLLAHAPNTVNVSMNYIASNNGLRNGDAPQTLYNLYANFGDVADTYRNDYQTTFRIATSFNADIKDHALTFGLEFDQRTRRIYILTASGLWTNMRQITETQAHIQALDRSKPILVPEFSGLIPYYYYDRVYKPELQSKFYESLLAKMGHDKNYTGSINPDEMDPETFDLNMFSAEDLHGNGSLAGTRRVNYIGYTPQGKKIRQAADVSSFLNDKDETGRNAFPVGAFKPIYSSVYVMDKFEFKNIKFNAGLRVDRYDANQQVLKDKYALHELATVGDLASIENLPAGFNGNVPSNISKDAAVYVAQNPGGGKSPIAIRGFREGDKWFNSEGNKISDPSLIASSDGRPIPLFKDMSNYDKKMSVGAFKQYKAVINPMPRIAFSFPISELVYFFAHYDILTQRPQNNNISLLDYYYLDVVSASSSISNPDQKPQQTIDYELGFEQVLNRRQSAKMQITSFYKEIRGQVNQRVVVGAYPKNYIIFDNIDFSTVKGLSVVFDFRRTGGSQIKANYTLQFAEGSGSNANSGANLASSGQPNLRILQPLDFDQRHSFVLTYDYRFGAKKEYKGPAIKTKGDRSVQVFENVGFNISFLLGSGTPYTRWNTAVPLGGNARSNLVGQINGSSKPWNFRSNLRVDKNIPLTWGAEPAGKDNINKDNKKSANLNIYLQVLNLFNSRNVLSVYNFTGSPDDDGYLSSTQANAALALANSRLAYSDMYSIRASNPSNFSAPRQTRIGVLFTF